MFTWYDYKSYLDRSALEPHPMGEWLARSALRKEREFV